MEQNQESSLFGLTIDQESKSHLSEAARWARFLAIVGFVVCGLIVIVGIFFGSIFSSMSSRYGGNDFDMGGMASSFGAAAAIMYVLIAILYFFPCLFLYRFATKAKTALLSNNQEVMNGSFQNLKKMFRYVGILTIIALVFYAIILLIVIAGAGASRF